MNHSWIQADARDILPMILDGSVDLVVTDPPYASLDKHRAKGTTTRLQQGWFPTMQNEEFSGIFKELYRILRKDAHLYVFCDDETRRAFVPLAEAAGFTYWKSIVWDKARIGMGYHYRAQHEYILFFEKGKRRLNHLGVPDVLRVRGVRGGYPTEKPVDLLSVLIQQSSSPGDVVLDPFAGSGATGQASLQTGRGFVGIDALVAAKEYWDKRVGDAENWATLRPMSEIVTCAGEGGEVCAEEERGLDIPRWTRVKDGWEAGAGPFRVRVCAGRIYLHDDDATPLWSPGASLASAWSQAVSEMVAAIRDKYGPFVSEPYLQTLCRLPDPR